MIALYLSNSVWDAVAVCLLIGELGVDGKGSFLRTSLPVEDASDTGFEIDTFRSMKRRSGTRSVHSLTSPAVVPKYLTVNCPLRLRLLGCCVSGLDLLCCGLQVATRLGDLAVAVFGAVM